MLKTPKLPPFSLAQLFMLTWLVGIWCAIWFHPSGQARPLLSDPISDWSVELADQLPRVVVSDCREVRVIDFNTGKLLFTRALSPVRGVAMRERWWTWPDAWNHYESVSGLSSFEAPAFAPSHFSDGRCFALQGRDFTGRYMAAYIFDMETGKSVQWRGKNTSANLGDSWSSGRNIGLRVGDGSTLGRGMFEQIVPSENGDSHALRNERSKADYVDICRPEVSSDFVCRIYYEEVAEDVAFNSDSSEGVISTAYVAVCDKDSIAHFDRGLRTRQSLDWPFGELEIIEEPEHRGNPPLLVFNRYRSLPDRLGVEADKVGWNIRKNQITGVPLRAQQVRACGDRLFVHDEDDSLYWIDCQSGARTYLIFPPRPSWIRTLHFAAWLLAWTIVARPKREGDFTRRFGYLLFAATTLALLPPSLCRFNLPNIDSGDHWLFAFACLVPLLVGVIVAIVRRSASFPALLVAILAFGLFASSWAYWSCEIRWGQQSSHLTEAINSLSTCLNSPKTDFIGPWRVGATKPDDTTHIEFRDKLQSTEVEP